MAALSQDRVSIGIRFAERLNQLRALTSDEVDDLTALIGKTPNEKPLRRWTHDQDTMLFGLLQDGLTAAEIGLSLGRSTDAVHTRIKRLKWKGKTNG